MTLNHREMISRRPPLACETEEVISDASRKKKLHTFVSKGNPMRRLTLTLLLLVANTSFAADSAVKQVNLGKLYQSYVKAGRSTAQLPDFGKRIALTGVVIEMSQGFSGGGLVKAGVAGSDDVLARLVIRDGGDAGKTDTLRSGAAFKATCTVAFASGANYIPLQDCVFH